MADSRVRRKSQSPIGRDRTRSLHGDQQTGVVEDLPESIVHAVMSVGGAAAEEAPLVTNPLSHDP